MFIASLFTKAKTWGPSKCPSTDEWIKKMWDILYHAILLSYTKGGSNAACSNKDEPKDCHTKRSKPEKDDDRLLSLNVECKKLIQMTLFTKQKQTHRHRKQTYGYHMEVGGRDKLGI